jgi:hypothetical protein
MAGILKVDQVQSDSNLAFVIAGSNVAFMNATSLQMVGSNVSLAGTNVFTSGKLVTAAQPVGAVLQVVQATTTTQVTVNTNTYTDIGLSATITPISTSNKILVITNVICYAPGSGNGFGIQAVRGSTVIWNPCSTDATGPYYNYAGSGGGIWGNSALMYLDSPSSTSSLTYKIQGRPYNSAVNSARFQNADVNNGGSSMIIMEIAG